MPTYEYGCDKCGHEFERQQRISDPPVKTCPSCKSRRVKKLISRTSFVLKGGGWYSDLYSSSKESAGKEGGGSGGGESSTESASSEPKTETKKATGDKPSKKKSGKKSKGQSAA